MFRHGLDFHFEISGYSSRDKRLFEISQFEIARVNCIYISTNKVGPDEPCGKRSLSKLLGA